MAMSSQWVGTHASLSRIGEKKAGEMPRLAWALNFIKGSIAILKNGSSFGRMRLLRAYWRIQLKKQLINAFRVDRKKETLWGQTIHFSDYTSFATLFEQVYISDDYFFHSENPNPEVIDCGANIGMTIAYVLAHYPNAHILAFEADPANYEILQINQQKNNWKNVEIFNLALDSKPGVTAFCSRGSGSMVGSLRGEISSEGAAIIEVQTAQLSKFIKAKIDFIKMDIEGSEQVVLDDLVRSKAIGAVNELVIEYHHHFITGENRLGQFLSCLETSGFGYHLKAPWRTPFSPAEQPQYLMIGAYRESSPRGLNSASEVVVNSGLAKPADARFASQ